MSEDMPPPYSREQAQAFALAVSHKDHRPGIVVIGKDHPYAEFAMKMMMAVTGDSVETFVAGATHAWFTCGTCGGVAFTIDDAPAFDSGRTCTCEVPTREPVRQTVTVRRVENTETIMFYDQGIPVKLLEAAAKSLSARNQRRLARKKR